MELRQLRYFIALAEELHFARAAARVGIEQSPLSKAISEMERNLGVRLFVRTRRSTRLTPVGETLLIDARRILADVDLARRRVQSAACGRSGRLRIAISDGFAHPRIAKLLAKSRDEDPQVDLQIVHSALPLQLSELCSGMLDVALSLSPRNDCQLDSVALWKDPAALVMRPDHELAAQQIVRQIDHDSGPFILLGDRLGPESKLLDGWLASAVQQPKLIEYVVSIELLLTLVATGFGLGLVSVAQAEMIRRPDLVVRPLNVQGATITSFLIRRRREPSITVSRFIERALKMVVIHT
jgi:DNA-binding transcriptional LysR family regulator